jgi:hypothetical protein
MPSSWILVAGTGVLDDFSDALTALAKHLGHQLAKNGFGLITGGWPGVDETVARAFADVVAEQQIDLENRLVQIVVEGDEPAFPAGELLFVRAGEEEWTKPIDRADCIVLLGGLGGTMKAVEIGLRKRKRVLPIADTGGDAKTTYLRIVKNWDRYGWMQFDRAKFSRLARAGQHGVNAALDLLVESRARS